MSMSIRQFAKELGVSHEAIRKAIRKEIIPPEAMGSVTVGSRTMPTIENEELAAKCYRAGQTSKGHQAAMNRMSHASPELAKARFAREMFRAKREQMRYEKEAGLIVPRSKVLVAIHAAGEALKKIVPPKHRSALEKILQALKDAIDRRDEDASS